LNEGPPTHTQREQTPGRSNRPLAAIVRALRHRNFRLFFGGQLVSLVGTWMQTVAQSWLVYRLTDSALLLGVVGFASQIPVFVLAPLGGALADRHARHRIVIATQTSMAVLAFVLAGLTLSKVVEVWQVIVLSLLFGAANAFDIPARQAFIVELVGKRDLMNAIALNSSMFNGARVLGPAVAGLLVASIGEGWCFFANGVSYVAVIAALLLMRLDLRRSEDMAGSALERVIEGFRYARHTAPVKAILLLVALVGIVGMPYTVLMPVFADRILHSGARGLGILMGATGLGALLGALMLAARSGVQGLGRLIAIACAGFGASLILFSFSRSFWVSVASLVPAGFSMMLQMASANTLLQAMVPDRLRGRVMALYSMSFMGMAPFGALISGAAAHRLGAPLTVALGAGGCVIGAALFALRLPRLRGEARQLIIAQGMLGGEPPEEMTTRGF
jgi:MFS family permease